LTGWDTQQDQAFAGPYHLSLQEGHKRLADWGWAEYGRGVQNASLYCFRHLVAQMEATPVSRASLQTRCGGMRLQSCPSTLSLDVVSLEFFFITSIE
jgi:hypothetical protein